MKKPMRDISISLRDNQCLRLKAYNDQKIHDNLIYLPEFLSAKFIMIYVSNKSEVFTHNLIKYCLDNDKRIAIPFINGEEILASEINNFNDLAEGPFGILQPKKKDLKVIHKKDMDLIIVPGVAFDTSGNRIGYGKGYYDKFLKKTSTITIALAYKIQIFQKLKTTKYDVPVDKIVTEEGIIECKKHRGLH